MHASNLVKILLDVGAWAQTNALVLLWLWGGVLGSLGVVAVRRGLNRKRIRR